jgi:hypothetical protein
MTEAHLVTAIWMAAPHHDVAPQIYLSQAALLLQRLDLHWFKLSTLYTTHIHHSGTR